MKNINSFTFCVINKKTGRVKFRTKARSFIMYPKYIAFYNVSDYNVFYLDECRYNIRKDENMYDFSVFVEVADSSTYNTDLGIKTIFK